MRIVKKLSLVFVVTASFFYGAVHAQGNDSDYNRLLQIPLQYTVLKTSEKIVVDGKDDEKDWPKAPWTQAFTDIVTGAEINSTRAAKCKMLWDDDFLYVYAKFSEQDLWASITRHDASVFQDNAFEIFISPGGGPYNYFEFQINAYGTVWDLFLQKPYRNGGAGLTSWDIKGLQKAVYLDGTLNDPTDKDKGWNIELAIPFSSVRMNGDHPPASGTIWRMNFSRVQWQLDTSNGKYFRQKDTATGKILHEHYSVWSPQGIVNLHYPERWGYVLFADTLSANNFLFPEVEKLKLLLWKYYYLQQEFKNKYGKFATRLKQLDKLYKSKNQLSAKKAAIKMFTDKAQFWIQVFLPSSDKYMCIDEKGDFRIESPEAKDHR